MNIIEKIKYILSMKDVGSIMQKYNKISVQELSNRFKHPTLREAISSFIPEEEYSAVTVIFPLGTFIGGQSSIPKGGSKAMAMRMVEKFSLGGTINAPCEVVDLDIEGDTVRRIKYNNGKSFEVDYVIAACDDQVLYERLLKGEYPDPKYQKGTTIPKSIL